MRNYNIFALVTVVILIVVGMSYEEAPAQVTYKEVSQFEKSTNHLNTGYFKVTAIINPKEAVTEGWIDNINYSSYYISDGQLIRIDANSTGTSILFLENGIYILDKENGTYYLYTDKTFYPEVVLDLEKNSPEILQIYNIFLKGKYWVKNGDNTWESGEPVIVNNNEDIKQLKVLVSVSETESLIEKIILRDEDNVQHDINLRYENLSKEETFEAKNYSMYSASLR